MSAAPVPELVGKGQVHPAGAWRSGQTSPEQAQGSRIT